MKGEKACLKCGSKRVIESARIIDRGDSGCQYDFSVVVYKKPSAILFKEGCYGAMRASICGNCGYTELYATKHVMRAYLAYENFTDGSSSYRSNEIQGSPVMKSLESARDFLWLFLDQNAEAILKDPPRLQWWVRHLSADLEAPGGRPFRRWFLLQLVATSDPDRSTVASPPKKQAYPKTKPMREPSALDPFLIVDLNKSPTPPSFAQALEQMTAPHRLTFEVWGVNPGKLPPTRIKQEPLEMGKWATDDSHVINQESWSDEKASGYEYGVSLWRLVGSRS